MPTRISEITGSEFLERVEGMPLFTVKDPLAAQMNEKLERNITSPRGAVSLNAKVNVRMGKLYFSKFGIFGWVELMGGGYTEDIGKIIIVVHIPKSLIDEIESILRGEENGSSKIDALRTRFVEKGGWVFLRGNEATLNAREFGSAAELLYSSYLWTLLEQPEKCKKIFQFKKKDLHGILEVVESELKNYLKEFDEFVASVIS